MKKLLIITVLFCLILPNKTMAEDLEKVDNSFVKTYITSHLTVQSWTWLNHEDVYAATSYDPEIYVDRKRMKFKYDKKLFSDKTKYQDYETISQAVFTFATVELDNLIVQPHYYMEISNDMKTVRFLSETYKILKDSENDTKTANSVKIE